MLGVVVYLGSRVVPAVSLVLPVGRQPGEERQQFRFGLVLEVIAAVLRPLALHVARRERDLPGGRRDRGLEVHPVLAAGQVVVVQPRPFVDRRDPRPLGPLLLLAIFSVLLLPSSLVVERRDWRSDEVGRVGW